MKRREGGVPNEGMGVVQCCPAYLFVCSYVCHICSFVSVPYCVCFLCSSNKQCLCVCKCARPTECVCVLLRVKGGSQCFCGGGCFERRRGGGGQCAKLLYRKMDRMDWRCRAVIGRWDDAALAQLHRWDVGYCWLTDEPSLGTTALDWAQRKTEGERDQAEREKLYIYIYI